MKTLTFDTKRRSRKSNLLYSTIGISMGSVVTALLAFLLTGTASAFNDVMALGVILMAVWSIYSLEFISPEDELRKKLLNVAQSADILGYDVDHMSLENSHKQIITGPIFSLTIFSPQKMNLVVEPDGCPNADHIYMLQHRLQEQFGLAAELIDHREQAVYWLYDEPRKGKELSDADFT